MNGVALDDQNSGTQEVREPGPLVGVQGRVDLLEGADEGVAKAAAAFDAALAGRRGLGLVELFAGEGVGELREGAAVVDGGLGPLGLQLVEDAGELHHLLLVEFELVGEKPERPAYTEAAAGTKTFVIAPGGHKTSPGEYTGLRVKTVGMGKTVWATMRPGGVTHD